MIYVVHFSLILALLAAFALFEVFGTFREGQSVMLWAVFAAVPGLLLAKPLKQPAIRRYATAWSLTTFAVISIGIGWYARRNAAEHHEELRTRLLKTPLQVLQHFSQQMPTTSGSTGPSEAVVPADDLDYSNKFALPETLDSDTAERLRLGISLAHKWLFRFATRHDYEKLRPSFDTSLRHEIDENSNRYVRNGSEAKIGSFLLAVGLTALAMSVVLFALRRRQELSFTGSNP